MKSLSFEKIINSLMFLYILSLYLFTFRDDFNELSNFFALLLMGAIWTNILLTKRKLKYNSILFIHALFILMCLLSVLYAVDQSLALTKVTTLILLHILMFTLVNYVDSLYKVRKILQYFVYSGFFSSIYILINSDLSNAYLRFGNNLGNVNAIGIIIGISSIFSMYFILQEKSYYKHIPILLINLFVVLITGSRIALLFVTTAAVVAIILTKLKKGFRDIIKGLVWGTLILSVGIFLVYNIPFLYEIIGKRVDSIVTFISEGKITERSFNIRLDMLKYGISLIKENFLFGYGIDNFRALYGNIVGGFHTYSHNNLIELIVGIGILGAVLFYAISLVLIKNLLQTAKYSDEITANLLYCFVSLIIAYNIISVGSIFYDSKHFIFLIAIGSVLYKLPNFKQVS